jgi:hypothetical protein
VTGRIALGAVVAAVVVTVLAVTDHDAPARTRQALATPPGWTGVWAVGDGADGHPHARAVEELIAAARPQRVLYLGDVYSRGTDPQFDRYFAPVYGALAKITDPTPGNHEWPRRAQGYDPYWREIDRRTPAPYYAFRLAGWQLLSLNSQVAHGRGSAQLRWLRRRLRGGGDCRIAYWHRPRFSAARHVPDQRDVAPLWDALRGRARLALNGHAHDMQRFRPVDGITELVAGSGGHRLHALNLADPRLAFGDDRHFGALRLQLRPRQARFAFVSTAGRVLDSGSVGC